MIHKIEISVDALGRGSLKVNDTELNEMVKGAQIQLGGGGGAVNQVWLDLAPAVDVTKLNIEGVVFVMGDEAKILDTIDPKAVEAEALELMGFDGPCETLAEAIIEVLKGAVNNAD